MSYINGKKVLLADACAYVSFVVVYILEEECISCSRINHGKCCAWLFFFISLSEAQIKITHVSRPLLNTSIIGHKRVGISFYIYPKQTREQKKKEKEKSKSLFFCAALISAIWQI